MFKTTHFVFIVAVAGSLLTACPEPNADDLGDETGQACNLGELSCQCNAGQCLGDLVCLPNNTCGEDGGGDGDGDGDCYDDGAEYKCVNGSVYWFDSCGNQTGIKEECGPNQICMNNGNGTAQCQAGPNCGDGIIQEGEGEECEGNQLNGATCQMLGFGPGTLVCTEFCTLNDLGCNRCGNGTVDSPSEQCDGQAGLVTCQELGFEDGGLVSCQPDCIYNTSNCINGPPCECDSGPCCNDGCYFKPAGVVCEANAETEYDCPWGTEAGSNVGSQTRDRQCSGSSAQCDGNYGPWSGWSVADSCSTEELCELGQMSCQACSYTYDVTQYECSNFSSANGSGPGGGKIMKVCATVDPNNGYMTVKARKYDGSTFGNRPYQVRVSDPGDDPCGPNAFYFKVSDSDPVNIGTTELTFSFPGVWLPGQTQKAYCVTASTQPGDLGYDANNPNQQSWWFSDKAVVVKQCN